MSIDIKVTSTVLNKLVMKLNLLMDLIDGQKMNRVAAKYKISVRNATSFVDTVIYEIANNDFSGANIIRGPDWDTYDNIRQRPNLWKDAAVIFYNIKMGEVLSRYDHYIQCRGAKIINGAYDRNPLVMKDETKAWFNEALEKGIIKPTVLVDEARFKVRTREREEIIGPDHYILVKDFVVTVMHLPEFAPKPSFEVTLFETANVTEEVDESELETTDPILEEVVEETEEPLTEPSCDHLQPVEEPIVVETPEVIEKVVDITPLVEEIKNESTVTDVAPSVEQVVVETETSVKPAKRTRKAKEVEKVIPKQSIWENFTKEHPFLPEGMVENLQITESNFFRAFLEKLIGYTIELADLTSQPKRIFVVSYEEIAANSGRGEAVYNNRSIHLFTEYCKYMGATAQRFKGQVLVEINVGKDTQIVLTDKLAAQLLELYRKKQWS